MQLCPDGRPSLCADGRPRLCGAFPVSETYVRLEIAYHFGMEVERLAGAIGCPHGIRERPGHLVGPAELYPYSAWTPTTIPYQPPGPELTAPAAWNWQGGELRTVQTAFGPKSYRLRARRLTTPDGLGSCDMLLGLRRSGPDVLVWGLTGLYKLPLYFADANAARAACMRNNRRSHVYHSPCCAGPNFTREAFFGDAELSLFSNWTVCDEPVGDYATNPADAYPLSQLVAWAKEQSTSRFASLEVSGIIRGFSPSDAEMQALAAKTWPLWPRFVENPGSELNIGYFVGSGQATIAYGDHAQTLYGSPAVAGWRNVLPVAGETWYLSRSLAFDRYYKAHGYTGTPGCDNTGTNSETWTPTTETATLFHNPPT